MPVWSKSFVLSSYKVIGVDLCYKRTISHCACISLFYVALVALEDLLCERSSFGCMS